MRLARKLLDLVTGVESWRLAELEAAAGVQKPEGTPAERLRAAKVDLAPAEQMYRAMGGDARVDELNRVPTAFSSLSKRDLIDLGTHARWQVHALTAIYGSITAP